MGQRDDEDDSSAVATSSNFATGSMEENGYRRRKPKHLRINTGSATSVATEGLGIELPVDGDQQRKRLSWDERIHASHQSQTATPRPTKNSFFTAPLPSKRHFIATRNNDDSSDDEIIRAPDIETGHPMPDRDLEDDYSRKRPSPYFKDAVEEQEVDDQKRGAFLKAVNRGVYKMTDRLSATFFDEVTGAEDGLVLPVRECERS